MAKVTNKYDVQAKQFGIFSEGGLSDEVESWVFLFEASMRLWWVVATTTSFSDEGSKSVSVSDDRWLLDGTAHIVVGEAEFVCEGFDHVRRSANSVIDHGVTSWSRHALFGGHRNQVELVDVLVSDGRVYDSSWKWVLEAAWVSSKESGVDSLACVDVHESG